MSPEDNAAPDPHVFDPNASDLKALCALENHLASLTLDDLDEDADGADDTSQGDNDFDSPTEQKATQRAVDSAQRAREHHAQDVAKNQSFQDAMAEEAEETHAEDVESEAAEEALEENVDDILDMSEMTVSAVEALWWGDAAK